MAKSACGSLHYVYKNLHVTHVTVSTEFYIFIFGGIAFCEGYFYDNL